MATSRERKLLDKFMKDMGWLGMFFVVAGFTIAWFGIIQPIALEIIEYRKFANREVAQEEKSVDPSRANALKEKRNFSPVYYKTPTVSAVASYDTESVYGYEEDESETADNSVNSVPYKEGVEILEYANVPRELGCVLQALEETIITAISDATTWEEIENITQQYTAQSDLNRDAPLLKLSINAQTLLKTKKDTLIEEKIASGDVVAWTRARDLYRLASTGSDAEKQAREFLEQLREDAGLGN